MSVNIPKSQLNIVTLLESGQDKLTEKRVEENKHKDNMLRGGNSGCIDEAGTVFGKCHRLSHLRHLGVEKPVSQATHLMFAAGVGNEDLWVERLRESWEGVILCEEEIPISWTTDSGVEVAGRPDIVLCDNDSQPQLGLELKLVSSPFSAYNYAAKGEPSLDHLIQAAHYSWQLDIPFKLVYTSRSTYGVGFGAMKTTWQKNAGHLLNEGGFKVEPFVIVYDLIIDNDQVFYQGPLDKEPQATPITISGIKKYYETVALMTDRQGLGPRISSLKADGSKMNWDKCDRKYCEFAEVCDVYEHEYERWLDECKKITMEKN